MFRILTLFLLVGIVACASEDSDNTQYKSKIYNPNGDSELALLMRDMFDDGMLVKQQVLKGETPKIRSNYRNIHTAEATQPEKVATEEFKSFASAYVSSVDAFMASKPKDRAVAFQGMVTACMQCHDHNCPGPKVKIRKLYLSETDMHALVQSE